jgi:proteasome lid subunit RPN8/RPN11
VTVLIPPAVRRAIVAHARRERPNECCGLLLGAGTRVRFAAAMSNVAARPARRYRIDDREHIALRRLLRRLEPTVEIVGAYHSHPTGPARPSEQDVRDAHYPDWIHVIVGFSGRRALIYAYRMRRGIVTTLAIAEEPTP